MLSFKIYCSELFYLLTLTFIPASALSTTSLLSEYDPYQKCNGVTPKKPISCLEGFHVKSDNKTCAPNDPLWNLLYVNKENIVSLRWTRDNLTNFQNPDYILKDSDNGNFKFIASDARNRNVYWTNVAGGDEGVYTSGVDINNSRHPDVIVDTGLYLPMGIAFDWVTGNIYFAETKWCLIAVCALNQTSCAVVIKEASNSRISDIALHPNEGIMFWTDEGTNEAIKRANMDGSNVTTIVSTYLSLPKGITVDEANSRIYWTDSAYDIIESSQFDGSDRRTITRATDPFGVDVFGDFVFWGNTKDNNILSINIFGGSATTIYDVEDLCGLNVIMHITKQLILRESSCKTANCSHICALSATKAQCLCPVGMKLTNEKNCFDNIESPKLLLSQQNTLLITRVNTLGRDTFDQIHFPPEIKAITALVYNPLNNSVIISDNISKNIVEYKMGSNDFSVLVHSDLINVNLIDFDPVGENLFWFDATKLTIEVFSLTTGARRILITECENVHDILFVADHGTLYYSKTSKTGNDEEIHKVVFSDTIKDTVIHTFRNQHERPVQLAFDRTRNTIIGTLRNTTHVTLRHFASNTEYYWKTGNTRQVYDSVHINNQLYWVDQTDKVKVLTTFNDDDRFIQFIKINHNIISGMASESPRKILTAIDRNTSHLTQLRRRHQCSTDSQNRKKCSHICLPSSIKFLGECWCPKSFSLYSDGQTCITEEKLSLSETDNHGVDEREDDGVNEAENLDEDQDNSDDNVILTTMSSMQSKENKLESFDQYKSNGTGTFTFYSIFVVLLAINFLVVTAQ